MLMTLQHVFLSVVSMHVTGIAAVLAVKTHQTVRLQTSASAVPPTLCPIISTQQPTTNSDWKEVKPVNLCLPESP